jgi:hypothetical protein
MPVGTGASSTNKPQIRSRSFAAMAVYCTEVNQMFELYWLALLAGAIAAVLGGALVFWQPGEGVDLRAVLADMRRCLTLGGDALEPAE